MAYNKYISFFLKWGKSFHFTVKPYPIISQNETEKEQVILTKDLERLVRGFPHLPNLPTCLTLIVQFTDRRFAEACIIAHTKHRVRNQ